MAPVTGTVNCFCRDFQSYQRLTVQNQETAFRAAQDATLERSACSLNQETPAFGWDLTRFVWHAAPDPYYRAWCQAARVRLTAMVC